MHLYPEGYRNWPHDLYLPLAVIAVPMVMSVVFYGEWLLLAFPAAVVAGYLFTPRSLWMVWLGSVVMMWVVYGGAVLLDVLPAPGEEPEEGETWWTFALESFLFMAGLVWLPVTIGRFLRRVVR
jgi:hypothetical protein